jgi:hypothetical protein
MAEITVQGRKVTVGDNFFKLSPEQQDDTVDEIAASMGQGEKQPQVGSIEDSLRTIPGHLLQGIVSIPGAVGDIPRMIEKGADWTVGKIAGKTSDEVRAGRLAMQQMAAEQSGIPNLPNPQDVIGTQKILDAVKPATGELYEPQTTAGKYTGAVASMAPAALAGGGGMLQRAGQAIVPGVASEAAGQATEGTELEPWARALAAVTGGVGVAMTSRRGVPERMATQAMGNLDDAALAQAGRLMYEARRMGVDLTWPEAVQQITNSGTRLGDLQRVVENSSGGGPVMREFYADRPQQVAGAAQQQFQQIAPQPMVPERLGPRVQQAADTEISGVNRAINNQTRPLYQAAEQQQLPPNSPALQDPAFQEAIRQIRNNPVLAPRFAHLPDNSIGMVDAAQKIMRSRAEALQVPGPGLNPYEASVTRQSRRQVTNEARNQSPEYAAAVQYQRQARDQYLNPLQEGPTGKLAGTTDVGKQTGALFPNKPQAQSEAGVSRAMRGIGRTDPQAAENLVRQHLETNFNEATQRIQSGQNPFGGAKFSAIVAGNRQQRRNLFAAIRALPHGDVLWRGFNRFLDVMEATGKRPAPNSATEFNAQLRKELEQGGLAGEAATILATPQKAMTFISDNYKRFRLGRGTEDLARLFTQGNLRDFQRLLRTGPNSPQAVAIMVRLIGQANAGAQTPATAN